MAVVVLGGLPPTAKIGDQDRSLEGLGNAPDLTESPHVRARGRSPRFFRRHCWRDGLSECWVLLIGVDLHSEPGKGERGGLGLYRIR